jgi:hypothetical protein
MWLKRRREGNRERSHARNHNQRASKNQSASIVSIVVGMVIRKSFGSRESERRELLRNGKTRIGTTLLMVCLSLVCHCPGKRPLCIRF